MAFKVIDVGTTGKLLALWYYGVEARPPGGGWRKPFVRCVGLCRIIQNNAPQTNSKLTQQLYFCDVA